MAKKKSPKANPYAGLDKHLNFEQGSYLEATSRPLYALAFLLPLVIVYEIGTFLVNTDQLAHTQSRVATFTWLMAFARWIGMSRPLALGFPALVVVILLFCWHMASHYPWRVRPKWVGGMAIESVVLTLPLFALSSVMNSSLYYTGAVTGKAAILAAGRSAAESYLANLTTSIGAGIYEELVFRLILIGLLILLLEDVFKIKANRALFIAIGLSALLFAAHHYIGIIDGQLDTLNPEGERFAWPSFIFRALAGAYFAFLFRLRGFGIIAGTHAAYDMINFTLKLFWAS